MPTGLLTESLLTQTSKQTSRRDFIDNLDTWIQLADDETPPQFLPLCMNETLSLSPCTPAPGEIFVFRFRSQWQRVSAHDSARWLTQDETRRAALLPSPALRCRAVLRLAVWPGCSDANPMQSICAMTSGAGCLRKTLQGTPFYVPT